VKKTTKEITLGNSHWEILWAVQNLLKEVLILTNPIPVTFALLKVTVPIKNWFTMQIHTNGGHRGNYTHIRGNYTHIRGNYTHIRGNYTHIRGNYITLT
jgi:hypothetical protein